MANENLKTMRDKIIESEIKNVRDTFECVADYIDHYRLYDMTRARVAAISDQTYTGSAITPIPSVQMDGTTLTKDTHYTLEYADNTNPGTEAKVYIKGKGDFFWTRTSYFSIVVPDAKNISKATVAAIADQTATGSAITPNPVVTLGDTTLTKDTHYTVTYTNNTEVGTASLTITGIAPYAFTKTVEFNIVAASADE